MQSTPQFLTKPGSVRAAFQTAQRVKGTSHPALHVVRTRLPGSHPTSREIFAWLNAQQATSVVLAINVLSVKALAYNVTSVQLCVPSVIHRLGLLTPVWRLYSAIAPAHQALILIQSKVFVYYVNHLVSLVHLPLTVSLAIAQTQTTLTSTISALTSSATRHVLQFQYRVRARFVSSVRPPALLALNFPICAPIVQKGCTFTSSNVCRSVLSGFTKMTVCKNVRRSPSWIYRSLSRFLRFCFQFWLEFRTFWKAPELIKRALRFTSRLWLSWTCFFVSIG